MSHEIVFSLLFLAIFIPHLKLCPVKLSSDRSDVSPEVFIDHQLVMLKSIHQSCDVFGVGGRLSLQHFDELVTQVLFLASHLTNVYSLCPSA